VNGVLARIVPDADELPLGAAAHEALALQSLVAERERSRRRQQAAPDEPAAPLSGRIAP
jgi:hypothetical protein